MIEKGNKKIINAWAMYDWANSVYALSITTAIFPIFYENITTTYNDLGEAISNKVEFFGFLIDNTSLYSYTLSFSFLLIAMVTPLLSGIADYVDNKKIFMKFFCYLGSIASAALYFFDPEHIYFGLSMVALASMGFSGSLVFYNAYLPEIAEPEEQDKVSAKGYSLGYIGSVILLILNLILVMFGESFGITEPGLAPRLCFVSVGIWWAGFAQITFRRLPDKSFDKKVTDKDYLIKGYTELKTVFIELTKMRRLPRYLGAFFVFNMGVQTIMYLAASYGKDEIKDMPEEGLIISILLIQLIAIGGSYFWAFMSARIGNVKALTAIVAIWIVTCYIGYIITQPIEFYGLAALVGFIMGGVQSLSRSTYSKFLPTTQDHSSYFSFYDVCEKMGIVLGIFSYGFILQLTGSARNCIFALASFFVVGIVLLFLVPKKETYKSQSEAIG